MEPQATSSVEAVGPPVDAESFPIVGVGSSAGGLQALLALIEALPPEPGLALVVIQHLAPEAESMLADIIHHHTEMSVMQVSDEPTVMANHVYVIPPDRTMIIEAGTLKLIPRENKRKPHMSVDAFLRSLAEDQTHRGVGVILSGTGTDGTLGLTAIKAEGGITFAQDDTAQHDGMPRSAIRAGCVDFVLPPHEIAVELVRIGKHPYVGKVHKLADTNEQGMQKVIRLLIDRTGVDFTNYRTSTLYRRISRRMLLLKLESLDDYVKLLRRDEREVTNLYTDILISVTSFFRDPQAYESIKKNVLPNVIRASKRNEPLRVWVMGCSTGEEAYSLAITISEYADEQKLALTVQIFSTDLNEAGIDHARLGMYNKNIAQDVSPERLQRYFIESEEGYQISKSIRDMCIFTKQNVLADPPFSYLSLISCRNMLIYLEPVLQRRVLPLFHYAIKTGCFLWLGSSETIGTFSDLFDPVDAKHRIYRKRPGLSPAGTVSFSSPSWDRGKTERPRRRALEAPTQVSAFNEADKIALNRYAPPGVLVSADLEILQYRGDTSPYLASPPGRPSTNLLKMARQGLIIGLRMAMQKASKENKVVQQEGLEGLDGKVVDLEIIPVKDPNTPERNYLILFLARAGDQPVIQAAPPDVRPIGGDGAFTRLTQELEATREYLQAMVEQQEAANEELQSANEEIQSSNEELQSINEEMQTSKEEIQSANEELNTVNDELRHRNDQLNVANSDLTNLLSGIHQPLVVLGRDLSVRRYTPLAEKMFNLIPSDIGRPITDVKFQFQVDVEKMLREVIDSVTTLETEVEDRDGKWHSLRIRPYRSLDNRIDGALLVLVDIDAQKRLLLATESAKKYAEIILANISTPLLVLDAKLRVYTASQVFYDAFHVSREETAGEAIFLLGNRQWDIPDLQKLLKEIIPANKVLTDYEMTHTFEHIGRRSMLLNAKKVTQDGDDELILLTIQAVTDRVMAREELVFADRQKDEFLALLAHELRNPLSAMVHTLDHTRATIGEPESAALMQRQLEKFIRLVDDLLDTSRISRGGIPLRIEPMDLRRAVQNAVASCRHRAEGKAQTLVAELPTAAVVVAGDIIRIDQVVSNLLNNAIKFTQEGGRIEVNLQREIDGAAVLTVTDNGIGMSDDLLPRVFDPFTQGDGSLTRESTGQGIGLSLAKRLVEQHGGTVQASSLGEAKGSTLTVRLPLTDQPIAVKSETKTAPKGTASPPRKFLLVDDYPDGANSLAMILKLEGHEATAVYSGSSAMEAVGKGDFDVVVTDLAMPFMDGFELTQAIRDVSLAKQPIVIVQTGYSVADFRDKAVAAGCDDIVVKPVALAALMDVVNRLALAPSRKNKPA